MIPMVNTKFPPPPGFSAKLFEEARIQPSVRPLKQDVVGDLGKVLWVLMGSIGVVLLIACANVANLLLVRAEARQHELAIRAALGAGWTQIAREMLLESVFLGVLGGAAGLGLAYWALRLLVTIAPSSLPRLENITIDPLVLLFTLAISLAAGLLFGLIPVVKYAAPRVASTLRAGGRTISRSTEAHRAQYAGRSANGAGGSSADQRWPDDPHISGVAAGAAWVRRSGWAADYAHFYPGSSGERSCARDPDVPGASKKDFSHSRCFLGRVCEFRSDRREQQHRSALRGRPELPGGTTAASPPVQVRCARLFSDNGHPADHGTRFHTDIYDQRPVAMISENMARELWREPAAAIGKRIREGMKDSWREIIGVVSDVRHDGADQKAPTTVYWPVIMSNFWGDATFVQRGASFAIRSNRGGSESFLKEMRQAVWAVDPDVPLDGIRTMQEVYRGSMARSSFTLVMLAIAGGMALLLGIIGIYGVISYSVSQRTREIGIRIALGAQQSTLKAMVVRHGVLLAAIGVAIGLAAAAGLTRIMSSFLFEISPVDPITYCAVSAGLLAAAAAASYMPAHKASVVSPSDALRAE